MTADGVPLFGSTALAERNRVEAQLISTATGAARARLAVDGSPPTWGSASAPSGDALDEIESAFAARGAATQVELSNFADPAIGAALTSRGYQLVSFENVL